MSYGSAGGVRAVEQLRLAMGELQVADVRAHVTFSIFTDFENGALKANAQHDKSLASMLDQLVKWSGALKALRA